MGLAVGQIDAGVDGLFFGGATLGFGYCSPLA
jgi:hypothetical protein